MRPVGTSPNARARRDDVALEASRDTYLDLYVNAPIPYLTLDRTGRIERVNHAAVELLGESARKLVGRAFETFVVAEDVEHWRDQLRVAKSQHRRATTEVSLARHGRLVRVRASSAHFAEDGERTMTVLVELGQKMLPSPEAPAPHETLVTLAPSSSSPRAVLDASARAAVPLLGDLCIAELCNAQGERVYLTSAHANAALHDVLRQSVTHIADLAGFRGLVVKALRTGRPQLSYRAGVSSELEAEFDQRMQQLGIRRAAVFPLVGRGRAMGVLWIATTGLRPRYGRAEIERGKELARRTVLALEAAPGLQQRNENEVAPTILLVEDDFDLLDVTAVLLRKLRYGVDPVSTAAAARAQADGRRFDLLLTDVRLPDGNGFDLMRALRSRNPSLKGIAVSGMDDKELALAAGFSAYLKKPVAFQDLSATIRRVL